ncbi:response regulator transcription factor [Tannerella forsythia]|uniref:DNA-binding response regulator n=1 Tax=Tannerella forsythia TaxID=28112 RepID=A0A3P1XKX8_TANFO|nr:response regulator transcription factor [Tannerella forsythia]RRD59432.1 DNA-binding response regulator [Tannerella forsythia]
MKNKHQTRILLVEDEVVLSMIIKDTLEGEGFELIHASDGMKGLDCFFRQKPDIVVADVMMPHMDGFEMVKKIRQTDKTTPILFLTARSSLSDLVEGFNLGANDYLKKPFKMLELIVRIKALINKPNLMEIKEELFAIGGYFLNVQSQWLTRGENRQELSYLECEVLKRLCINMNNVVEIKDILNDLWNDDSLYNRNSLHVFIYKLRKRLSGDPRIRILNVRGLGYKLVVSERCKPLP